MPAVFARVVAWFRSMPVAQQVLIGIGVPAVAGAAIIGNVRAKGKGEGDGGPQAGRGGQGLTGPASGGIEIPFGGGLGELFGLQTAIANVETTLMRRIEAIRRTQTVILNGQPPAPAESGSTLVGSAIFTRVAPTLSPATSRTLVKSPTVRNAEAVTAAIQSPAPVRSRIVNPEVRAAKARLRTPAPAPVRSRIVNPEVRAAKARLRTPAPAPVPSPAPRPAKAMTPKRTPGKKRITRAPTARSRIVNPEVRAAKAMTPKRTPGKKRITRPPTRRPTGKGFRKTPRKTTLTTGARFR